MATTRLIKSIVFRVPYLSVRSSRSSASRFAGVAILDEYQISSGGGGGSSLLRRGLFVLWGGWGERKRERAGHDRKGKKRREVPAFSLFPSSPARFLIFPIIAIFIGITSGSLCGGERGGGRGGGGCTAINPDAVPSVHVTKVATCTGICKHSIFRISRKIEECEQSTYKVNSRFSKFITFIPCALICQKLVNFLELNSKKNCIEV